MKLSSLLTLTKEELLVEIENIYRKDKYAAAAEAKIPFELFTTKVPDTFEENFWALTNVVNIFGGKIVSSRVRYFVKKTISSCKNINQARKTLDFCSEKYLFELLEVVAKLDCSKEELSLFLLDCAKKYKE